MLEVKKMNEELHQLCSSFSCGNQHIDSFLKSSNSVESDICKTYVLVRLNDENLCPVEVIGFYSLSTDSVLEKAEYESQTRIIQCGPAIRIYMFAIDKKYQHKRIKDTNTNMTIASMLLLDCLDTIEKIVTEDIGATFIILSATQEGKMLYKTTGEFSELDDDLDIPYIEGNGKECIEMYKPIFDY